jgi:hypothetical protein
MLKKLVLLVFLILIGACTTPIVPPPKADIPIKVVEAPIEIALTGIGSAKLSARVQPQALGVDVSNRIILGDAIIRSSTDIVPLGQPRTAGHRYFHVTLPISLLEGTFANLTFMAVNDPKNNQFSAVSELARYPGLPAYTQSEFDALANSIEPTSPIQLEPQSLSPVLVRGEELTLQIYTEAEVSSLPNTLPYGFVAHNRGSRFISSTGTITIAMRVPLQALAKDDPYTIKLRFGIYEDDTTFITESLQAQQPNNQVRFQTARTRVSGALRVMPGTTQKEALAICQVRTVGTAISPTAYLVNRVPTSVELQTRVITMGQTLPLETTISDAVGEYYLPTQITLTDPNLGDVVGDELTAFNAGATTVNTSVCGLTGVGNLNLLNIVKPMAGGLNYSLAIKSDGAVATWGNNVGVPSGLTDAIALGSQFSDHSLALKPDGTVVAWGRNSATQSDVPTDLTNVIAIATGFTHSLSLKSNGTVVAWGANNYFQSNVPSNLKNIASITGGVGHSLALKSNGTVTVWGALNNLGQTDIPSGLSNVIAISAGAYHNLALKQDGTIVAWGSDSVGQSTIPNGLSDVIAISAGANHSLALKTDGTVVAWGDSGFGESTVPNGLTDVVAIAAGGYHSLALKADGSIVAWGNNTNNQIDVPIIAPLIFKIP